MVMDKQIYAAMELVDHEIRLVLGEFFNTRFNVLKVERVACSGIENLSIIDKKAVISTIQNTIENASKRLGSKIERVLLSIPSKNARRISMKVTVPIESIDRKVTVLDIRKAIRKAMNTKLESNLVLINAVASRYTCNGITTRRVPLGEVCSELTVQIDLLCADRDLTYDVVSCIEGAGCEVLDVCLDCYAIAKEACLFEQTVDQNMVVLKLEQNTTTMALLYGGKLVSSDILKLGYKHWVDVLSNKVKLPFDIAARLCKYNCQLDATEFSETPIYIWSRQQTTYTLSEKQLCEAIKAPVEQWLKQIKEACQDIVSSRTTTVVLTGEGAEIQGLDQCLKAVLGCEVKKYAPDTLGARTPALACCLGLFYAYKDQSEIRGGFTSSINMEQFKQSITYKKETKEKTNNDENTLTSKLKSILFDTK